MRSSACKQILNISCICKLKVVRIVQTILSLIKFNKLNKYYLLTEGLIFLENKCLKIPKVKECTLLIGIQQP